MTTCEGSTQPPDLPVGELNAEIIRREQRHAEEYRSLVMDIVHQAFMWTLAYDQEMVAKSHAPEYDKPDIEQLVAVTELAAPFRQNATQPCLSILLVTEEGKPVDDQESLWLYMPLPEGFATSTDDPEEIEVPDVVFVEKRSSDGTNWRFAITREVAFEYTSEIDPVPPIDPTKDEFDVWLDYHKLLQEHIPRLAEITEDMANMKIVTQHSILLPDGWQKD